MLRLFVQFVFLTHPHDNPLRRALWHRGWKPDGTWEPWRDSQGRMMD